MWPGAGATSTPAVVYVAPAGNDSTCAIGKTARPCLTFDRAVRLAPCGATVEVAAGTYAAQTIKPRSPSCTKYTTITPVSGANVTVGNFTIEASYIRVAGTETAAESAAGSRVGFNVQGGVAIAFVAGSSPAQDVVPDHVQVSRTNSMAAYVAGATNVTLSGLNVGPLVSCEYGDSCADDFDGGYNSEDLVVILGGRDSDGTVHTSTNVTIANSYLHDLTKVSPAQYPSSGIAHSDCIQLYSWNNVTISGNHFHNCPDTNIFAGFADGDSATYDNLRVEHNLFEAVGPSSFWGTQFPCTNTIFRFNEVLGQDARFYCSADHTGTVLIEQNILPSVPFGGCDGVTRKYNFYMSPSTSLCDPMTESAGHAALHVVSNVFQGKTLRMQFILVSGQQLQNAVTVFGGRRVLYRRTSTRGIDVRSGVQSFAWHDGSKARVTRVCVRAYGGQPATVATACAPTTSG